MSRIGTASPAALDKTNKHLARNSAKAVAGTLISRTCGVFRTLIINATFGATTTLDAFNVAFRFPNSLRDLFADGALSAAFIKILVDVNPKGQEAIRKLISIVSGFFLVVTLLIAIMVVFFAKPLLLLITGHQFAIRGGLSLATTLFRILIFYLPITMLNSIVMAVLGIKGDTFRAMNGSIFLNFGMILGALLLAPILGLINYPPILGLAIGSMLGVFLQLIYQAYPLRKWGLLVIPNFNPRIWWNYSPLRQVLLLMGPRALGQGAMIIALIINTFFAIQVGTGAFTYISTTVIIIQVPIGLFGVATGFAALPLLSAAYNEGDGSLFSHLLTESLKTAKWLSLFTLIIFSVFIVPIYIILFQHGRITFHDTIENSVAICAYSIGIFFATNGKVLLNALYAINLTRQIIFNSLAYLVVNATLSAWLTPHFGLIGLGCSFATATAVDCWLNLWVIQRAAKRQFMENASQPKSILINEKNNLNFFIFSLISYLIGFFGIALCRHFWPSFTYYTHLTLNIWVCLLISGIGGFIFLLFFIILLRQYGPKQLQHIIQKIF